MKYKILTELKNYDGETIKEKKSVDGKTVENPLTYRAVVTEALNSFLQGETPTGDDKAKCYLITRKVYESKEPDLTIEEVNFIIERVKKIWYPIAVGQSLEFFNNK